MARGSGLGRELRKIESEEKAIEKEEKSIEYQEKAIEEKEDLLRVFEELGLMRWKSYYILTAGAILLLALTFVSALWVMHDQLTVMGDQLTSMEQTITTQISTISTSTTQRDWCPAGKTMTVNVGTGPTTITIVGKELHNSNEMCHGTLVAPAESGQPSMDIWFDQTGGIDVAPVTGGVGALVNPSDQNGNLVMSVSDAQTGAPLEAQVSLFRWSDDTAVGEFTTPNGIGTIAIGSDVPNSKYYVIVRTNGYDGYSDIDTPFSLVAGQTTDLDIHLAPSSSSFIS